MNLEQGESMDNQEFIKKNKLLICIYSSHNDLKIAKQLREQINNSTIKNQKNIIVLSDNNQNSDFRYDENEGILYLKVKECYTHLSIKTKIMFNACLSLFDFDFLLKWDAGTKIRARRYSKKDSAKRCLRNLKHFKYDCDYWGHLKNTKIGGLQSKNWFIEYKNHFLPTLIEENRDLDSEHFIPKPVPYFRGKFYIVSKNFCNFIQHSPECDDIFQKNFQHNYGCEDMSVGMCFKKFKKTNEKS